MAERAPRVRVIWPAPADNATVLEPGEYTVTGAVAGTALRPRAKVTVRKPHEALAGPHTVDGEDAHASIQL